MVHEILEPLRQARLSQQISFRKLQKLTGINRKRLARIEKGLVEPRYTEIHTLARVLDLQFQTRIIERYYFTRHAQDRYLERFRIFISMEEQRQIVHIIESGEAFLVQVKGEGQVYEIDDKWFVYAPETRIVITVYVANWEEVQRWINYSNRGYPRTLDEIMASDTMRRAGFTREAVARQLNTRYSST